MGIMETVLEIPAEHEANVFLGNLMLLQKRLSAPFM